MRRHARRSGIVAACLLVASGCSGGAPREGAPSAGSGSASAGGAHTFASTVPEGYVATASGYQHASCVVKLAPGDQIIEVGTGGQDVRAADGSVRHFAPCPYPTLNSSGHIVASKDGADAVVSRAPEADVHLASSVFPGYGQVSPAAAPIMAMRSTMIVPGFRNNEDPNDSSQIDLWPGLQNASPSTWVLQPVLQLFATSSWFMFPVYNHGTEMSMPGVAVNGGDTISGTATGSNCNSGTGICSTWTVQMTNLTTGESTAPLVVTSFADVARRVILGVLELHTDFPITDCLSLPSEPLPNFVTEWQTFNGTWSNTKPTIVKNTESPDCLYDAWVAPKGNLSSVYVGWWPGYNPYPLPFNAGDDRVYTGLSDWAQFQYKSECDTQDWVVGLSSDPSTGTAHAALCAYDGNVNSKLLNPSWSVAVDFSSSSQQRDNSTGNWDINYNKGECASNEAVTGIAQSMDGKLTKILCTRMYQEAVSGACYTRVFQGGDNRGNTTGDWDYGYWKGQCDGPASTTVVKGVSRNPSTGQAHAILCCPTAFTP